MSLIHGNIDTRVFVYARACVETVYDHLVRIFDTPKLISVQRVSRRRDGYCVCDIHSVTANRGELWLIDPVHAFAFSISTCKSRRLPHSLSLCSGYWLKHRTPEFIKDTLLFSLHLWRDPL